MVPRISLCIHFFLGPTVTQSSVVPVFDNLFGVAIESTGEDSGPLRFLLGVGGVYRISTCGGGEQTPVYLVCSGDFPRSLYW